MNIEKPEQPCWYDNREASAWESGYDSGWEAAEKYFKKKEEETVNSLMQIYG